MWQHFSTTLGELRAFLATHLYLPYCLVGEHFLEKGEALLCTSCLTNLTQTRFPHTPYGFLPEEHPHLDNAISCWEFDETFQRLIHAAKYQKKPSVGRILAEYACTWTLPEWMDTIDLIIPIPLHPTRYRDRGYNQAVGIAQGFTGRCKALLSEEILIRSKYTKSQTRLSRKARQENLSRAFAVAPKNEFAVEGAVILLVDDVFTTGSTLGTAAVSLCKSGAKRVYGFTLATAPLTGRYS